jgi:hypothetical protein
MLLLQQVDLPVNLFNFELGHSYSDFMFVAGRAFAAFCAVMANLGSLDAELRNARFK